MTRIFYEFPKMLYRGKAHLSVADAEGQAAALKDGWRTADQLRALDGDDDNLPGGSKPRRKVKP